MVPEWPGQWRRQELPERKKTAPLVFLLLWVGRWGSERGCARPGRAWVLLIWRGHGGSAAEDKVDGESTCCSLQGDVEATRASRRARG